MHIKARILISQMAIMILAAPAAYAGFQWVPPVNNVTAIPVPITQSILAPMPLADIDLVAAPIEAQIPAVQAQAIVPKATTPAVQVPMAEIPMRQVLAGEPITITTKSMSAPRKNNKLQISPIAQAEYRELAPLMAPRTSNIPPKVSAPNAVQNTAPSPYAKAVGFGSDLPLAIALGQIIPPEYIYSFDQGVNPGARVSWTGGKSWNFVLSDMLSSVGLTADISGKSVYIRAVGERSHSNNAQPRAAPVSLHTLNNNANKNSNAVTAMRTLSNVPIAVIARPTTKNPISLIKRHNITDPGMAVPPRLALRDHSIMMTPLPAVKRALAAIAPAAGTRDNNYARIDFWEVEKGSSLKDTLIAWGARGNIDLIWESSYDYRVSKNIMINDSFRQALKAIMTEGLNENERPSFTFLEDNNNKAPVLIIRDAG